MAGNRAKPDLVRDSELETHFTGGDAVHTFYFASETQRKTRREDRWRREERLGDGAFGTVWKERLVNDSGTSQYRAVKKIGKQRGYVRELNAIAKFSHEKYNHCFVKSLGWYERDDDVFIAMEYLPLGCLKPYLSSRLPEHDTKEITLQILEGLSHMHANGFVHRDLKPTNILVKSAAPDWWVKIADFGISKREDANEMTSMLGISGTYGFIAPEVFVKNGIIQISTLELNRYHNAARDMWSLGVIVYEALSGTAPFLSHSREYIRSLREYIQSVQNVQFSSIRGRVSKDAYAFLQGLLAPMPNDRMAAETALSHAWIADRKSTSRDELPDIPSLEISENTTSTAEPPIAPPSGNWNSTTTSRTGFDTFQSGKPSTQTPDTTVTGQSARGPGTPCTPPPGEKGNHASCSASKDPGTAFPSQPRREPANEGHEQKTKPGMQGSPRRRPYIPGLPDHQQPVILEKKQFSDEMVQHAVDAAHEAVKSFGPSDHAKIETDVMTRLKRYNIEASRRYLCRVGPSLRQKLFGNNIRSVKFELLGLKFLIWVDFASIFAGKSLPDLEGELCYHLNLGESGEGDGEGGEWKTIKLGELKLPFNWKWPKWARELELTSKTTSSWSSTFGSRGR